MKKIFLCIVTIISIIFLSNNNVNALTMQFDDASRQRLNEVFQLLKENNLKSDEEKIDIISAYFLDTPYVANRLVGSATQDEELVIALNELDCFTYLDYLESFRRSTNEEEFIENLKVVRYIDGEVTYLKRKHFYSDWFAENKIVATDILSSNTYDSVRQTDTVDLNQGASGVYINGLAVRTREINYIPRNEVNADVLRTFKTGDYIGLRRDIAGLDVTHTGLIIQKTDGTYMRHASSASSTKKVVDQKITDYLANYTKVKGILVFRSNAIMPKIKSIITVSYVDETGQSIKENTTQEVLYGSEYTVQASHIDNYALQTDTAILSSVAKEENINIQLVYKKIATATPIQTTSQATPETRDQEKMNKTIKQLPATGDSHYVLYVLVGVILLGISYKLVKG